MEYQTIIEAIAGKLKAITHKIGSRSPVFNAEDLYQEACLFLWEGCLVDKWQDKNESYILQACYFFLKNYVRKALKGVDKASVSLNEVRDAADGEETVTLEGLLRAQAPDCRCLADAHILAAKLGGILDSRERTIFNLRAEGATVRQIGRRLGISHVMVIKIERRIRGYFSEVAGEYNRN